MSEQTELKKVEFVIPNAYIKEMLQMDKNKHHGDLSKLVFQVPQIDQTTFNRIFLSKKYRVDIHYSLLLDEEDFKRSEQHTEKGKRSA